VARTPEGKRLTDAHKQAQIRLGALAAALTVENAKRLDVDDLDGTREAWLTTQAAIIEALRRRSEILAEDYLRAFWKAEGIKPSEFAELDLRPAREVMAWVVPVIKTRKAKYAAGG